MSKSCEHAKSLMTQLESMGIITETNVTQFWLELVMWTVESATVDIYEKIVDYFTKLPNLTIAEQAEEEARLRGLDQVLELILDELDHEKMLSNSDVKFKRALERISLLFRAFNFGRRKDENPADEINRVYQAGLRYGNPEATVLSLEESNDE